MLFVYNRYMSKHDWGKIKTEYICTDISLRKLAKKYGVCNSKMFDRCSRENWVVLRKIFRYHTCNEARRKRGFYYDYERDQELWELFLSCM